MDFKQIQELIKMVNKHNIADLKIEEENFKIQLKTVAGVQSKGTVIASAPLVQQAPIAAAPAPVSAPIASTPAANTADSDKTETGPTTTGSEVIVKSPIIGTFYRSPGPDKEPFVKVGDSFNEGDVLCIIEAMKLFNEIDAEFSGKIVKILVEDASPIEYDQPLFVVEPA